MPQGTRSQFGASLEPAEDLPRGKVVSDLLNDLVLRQPLMRQASMAQCLRDLRFAIADPVKGMGQLKLARLPERLMVVPQGATERGARVGRARRHPNRMIVGLAENARVGVQCYAAGQDRLRLLCFVASARTT